MSPASGGDRGFHVDRGLSKTHFRVPIQKMRSLQQAIAYKTVQASDRIRLPPQNQGKALRAASCW